MRFHASRTARDRHRFDDSWIEEDGSVSLADFHAARRLADALNRSRDLVSFPEQTIRAGQLNAMGLIGEILRFVASRYAEQLSPRVVADALDWLDGRLGRDAVDRTLTLAADEFPPPAVHRGELTADAYLQGETAGVPHRVIILGELMQLWLANTNPAKSPFLELFDDARCERETLYLDVIRELRAFFATQPTFGPDHQPLIEMLESPALAVPHSLPGQLDYIRNRWGHLLGKYYYRLLGAVDLIREEERVVLAGPGPARVYEFAGLELESERFSPDREWMPRVVMIAKNTHVWLDQLSRRHRRSIERLDQIPDEELERLRAWGITALWLIGLWERSPASRRIKHLCGNENAAASAYSLRGYRIAEELGGDSALADLARRADRHGIRLSSDMVPNHTGIDGDWVIEHPDWFLALPQSPFPSYTFNGPDLSPDRSVGIFLEDHYYSRDDAAVVFRRIDRHSNSDTFIYHGNDGTNMPWNDTAQLNYLNPEVREAVIQTILHVARRFPIIRFDAAMTLAKRHYQRLWFPEPGSGGAIPTRAEHGLSRAEFSAAMPKEFWREVVDRVARDAPDTLLLAEAFWLMEGYFVRTLGMHRVYNSAFMVMLRDEDNANYRSVIKNTLAFDPRILKRYVNFMSNPDERTAVDQFGKSDKYFGVCTMMVTMPGLPMLAHGQVEGFAEKYGMDYQRPMWEETPDPHLLERHEREIFPLMKRRPLFAEVDDFVLYDFWTTEQAVNEDVFAYSNRIDGQSSLIVYHNRYADTRGWIRNSVPYSVKEAHGERRLVTRTLGEGLALGRGEQRFCIFRDQARGLEFIRRSAEIHGRGLYIELGAYERHVFLDFREVEDDASHRYSELCAFLDGRGVPSIEEALHEIFLQPIQAPYRALVNADLFRTLTAAFHTRPRDDAFRRVLAEVERSAKRLFAAAGDLAGQDGDSTALARDLVSELEALAHLTELEATVHDHPGRRAALRYLTERFDDEPTVLGGLLGWLFTHALGRVASTDQFAELSRSWIDEWLLGRVLAATMEELGLDSLAATHAVDRVRVLTSHQSWHHTPGTQGERQRAILESLFRDPAARGLLEVNRYQDVLWFSKEAFEDLAWWLMAVAAIEIRSREAPQPTTPPTVAEARPPADGSLIECHRIIDNLLAAAEHARYQVGELFKAS